MTVSLQSFIIIISALFLPCFVVSKPATPKLDARARVKEHRKGAEGNLVPGEEDLRKIIVSWDHVSEAEDYEVCHNCHITTNDEGGTSVFGLIHDIPKGMECGGRPCFVLPGAPLGLNTFHLRVKVKDDDEVSDWSEEVKFFVEDPGHVHHDPTREEL